MIFFHFKFFVSKFEGWKGRHFYGRPRAALSLATPLVTTLSKLRNFNEHDVMF